MSVFVSCAYCLGSARKAVVITDRILLLIYLATRTKLGQFLHTGVSHFPCFHHRSHLQIIEKDSSSALWMSLKCLDISTVMKPSVYEW